MAVLHTTTKDEFHEKVLNSDKLVLVDFWAEWCPPCRAMAPILDTVADDLADTLDIVKVDVEASIDNNSLSVEHGVRGIPNMQLFKNGKKIDEFVGMRSRSVLLDDLKQYS